jgi:hypothetical protein
MDSSKVYKNGITYPLIKGADDTINDYIIINKKFEKYQVVKGDLIIGTKGTCGNIRIVNVVNGYHKHGILKLANIKINKSYIYYYIKQTFDYNYIKQNTIGSVLAHMNKENIINTQIKVLKPQIMKKYKIQELFDEVDKMREDIETNKLDYEKLSNEFMLMIDQNYKKDESKNELEDEQPTDEPLDEVKEVKKIKKVVVKKNNINKLDESIDDLADEPVIEPIKKVVKKVIKKKSTDA